MYKIFKTGTVPFYKAKTHARLSGRWSSASRKNGATTSTQIQVSLIFTEKSKKKLMQCMEMINLSKLIIKTIQNVFFPFIII